MQTIITQTNEARKEAKEAEEASVATKTALQKAETAKADGMYENIKMDPKTLADTVNRYNSFVAAGKDDDWGKTT